MSITSVVNIDAKGTAAPSPLSDSTIESVNCAAGTPAAPPPTSVPESGDDQPLPDSAPPAAAGGDESEDLYQARRKKALELLQGLE